MKRKVVIQNHKGGVGKTSTAVKLAAYLARAGESVLLLDTCAQGHVALAFGMEQEPCFYDLMVRKARWQDVLRLAPAERYATPDEIPGMTGKLLVLPGNAETSGIISNISDPFLLLRRVQQLENVVDWVIVDTSPSESLIHTLTYALADEIFLPVVPEAWSINGMMNALAYTENYSTLRTGQGLPPTRVLGILPTKYKGGTVEHQENVKLLKAQFGDLVWEPVVERIAWSEAARKGLSLFRYAPGSQAALEAAAFCERARQMMEAVIHG